MAPRERKSYFLYGEGRAPDVLCLGNLVLGSYANPTTARHYTHKQLSHEELKNYVSSTKFQERTIHAKHGPNYGIQLDGAQLVDLGISWHASQETILTAKAGTRMELIDPESFLNTEIMQPGSKAEENLKLWLSAANSEFLLKMKWMRKPTIWMCTGLYLLEGTKVFTVSHNKISTSVGIDSNIIGAVTGVPLGGSITISPETSLKLGAVSEDRLVWAAQYRKLEAKYIRLSATSDAALPSVLSLYPDITSHGTLRDESGEINAAQVVLGEDSNCGDEDGQDEMLDERGYYESLAKAIEDFEDYL